MLITVTCFQHPVWANGSDDKSFSDLPDDIVCKILQNVRIKDRAGASCVCTEWKKISPEAQKRAIENFEKQYGHTLAPLLERVKTLHKEDEKKIFQEMLDAQLISAIWKKDLVSISGLLILGADVSTQPSYLLLQGVI